MDGKKRLFIGLLVVGLVLLGSGLWFNPIPQINVPENPPIITMDITHTMGGTISQLLIYEEGTIIYPGMPYPLNEIYRRLKDIAENQTEEVYKESLDGKSVE